MKNHFLLPILLLGLLPGLLYSQSTTVFGFKGGLSLGNADAKVFDSGSSIQLDTKFRPSLYAGAFLEYSLEGFSENLYSQLELQYVSLGSKLQASAASPESTTSISQLNLPFILKYRVAEPLLITAGFYWGLLLQVEEDSATEASQEVTKLFETFDSGLLIGLEVPIGESFFLETRYNYGLLDIMDLEKTGNRRSYFNRFLQIGVGIRL